MTVAAPKLFEPLKLRSLTLRNRVGMSPMCMYSCFKRDGVPTMWHMQHIGARAAGGVGLIVVEATAVEPRGRISLQDTGLWNDEQANAWKPIIEFAHEQGARVAIQLAHAGRKAQCYSPLKMRGLPLPDEEMWDGEGRGINELHLVAPSAIAWDEQSRVPHALTEEGIVEMKGFWVDAAKRAIAAGFDAIELHYAHGYLIHEFLSPLTNKRTDQYGGSFENRIRLPLEIIQAVREVMPEEMPLLVRISAHDWAEGGWNVEESTKFARIIKEMGVDLLDVSSGGAIPNVTSPVAGFSSKQGYQVPFAEQIRRNSGITTACVGLISDPEYAESLLQEGKSDLVMIGRELLNNPNWVHHAALKLGVEPNWPRQYGWGLDLLRKRQQKEEQETRP